MDRAITLSVLNPNFVENINYFVGSLKTAKFMKVYSSSNSYQSHSHNVIL